MAENKLSFFHSGLPENKLHFFHSGLPEGEERLRRVFIPARKLQHTAKRRSKPALQLLLPAPATTYCFIRNAGKEGGSDQHVVAAAAATVPVAADQHHQLLEQCRRTMTKPDLHLVQSCNLSK